MKNTNDDIEPFDKGSRVFKEFTEGSYLKT